MQDSVHEWPMLDSTSETIRSICQPPLEAMIIGGTALAESGNLFLLLINPPLILNNKSGNPKMPHEHFKRGCTYFKRSKTIMN